MVIYVHWNVLLIKVNIILNNIIFKIFYLLNYYFLDNLVPDSNNICKFCDVSCSDGKCSIGNDSTKCI